MTRELGERSRRTTPSRPATTAGRGVASRRVASRRVFGGGLVWLGVLLAGGLGCAPGVAWGDSAYRLEPGRVFGGAGAGAGQMGLAAPIGQGGGSPEFRVSGSGVAVNDETHDVYVADTGEHRVDEFQADGTFMRAWGWGVADGLSMLETCGPEALPPTSTCKAGLSGSAAGELAEPRFITVDNYAGGSRGDVYVSVGVGDEGAHAELVTKYGPEGKLEAGWGDNGPGETANGQINAKNGAFEGELAGIAADPTGDLWVYDSSQVYEFDEAGKPSGNPFHTPEGSRSGIAISEAGDIYLVGAEKQCVEGYTPAGSRIGCVTTVRRPDPTAFALDGATSEVFADLGDSVEDVAPGLNEPLEFGEGELAGGAGLAVNTSTGSPFSGSVYVADTTTSEIDVFAISLEARTTPVSDLTATSALLEGEVNPHATNVTSCAFHYANGAVAACLNEADEPVSVAHPLTGEAPVKVHATAEGLSGGTGYEDRLRVANTAGETLESGAEGFQTLTTATIEHTTSEKIEAHSALLAATVNPNGVPNTKCSFQYGASEAYEHQAPCEPSETLSGSSPIAVSLALTGLTPGSEYHWRILVTDEDAPGEHATVTSPDSTFVYLPPSTPQHQQTPCPNETLRHESDLDLKTGQALSLELPDCRAYELVTPAHKNAALLAPLQFAPAPQLSENGERVMISSDQCFAEATSCTARRELLGVPFAFSRTTTGWVTTPLAPPASILEDSGLWGYDASTGMVLYSAPTPGQTPDSFFARTPEGTLEPIGPVSETEPFINVQDASVRATSDLSHIVFSPDKEGIWPSLTAGTPLFEYTGTGNSKPFLVNVEVGQGQGSTKTIGSCGELAGNFSSIENQQAVSTDGTIVYFNTCEGGIEGGLYARVDGEQASARTIAISTHAAGTGTGVEECDSASGCASSPTSAGLLGGASGDGSRVYFTSTQKLTNDASEDPTGTAAGSASACQTTPGRDGCNLYLFEGASEQPLSGHNLVDVSAGDSSGEGPEVKGVMAVSADGSHVYFIAGGVLTGANKEGHSPVEGAANLYVWERDPALPTGGHSTFIATLPGGEPENQEWGIRFVRDASVTPDGEFLVFTSSGALAGGQGGPEQVFRYDAETEHLQRVSIAVHGLNDDGNAPAGDARIAVHNSNIGQLRRDPTVSDDASLVFFQSPAGLTPGALNNTPVNAKGGLAQNIYEWQAPATHGCEEPTGCINLISDGHDTTEANSDTNAASSVELLGTDTTGQNVLFTTADELVPADTDSELDYYDARVNGGFPAPTTPTPCQGEECHPQPSPPAAFGPIPSEALTGTGNLPTPAPPPTPKPTNKPKPPTNKEKLAKALHTCHKDKPHSKRTACERHAHKLYDPTHTNQQHNT